MADQRSGAAVLCASDGPEIVVSLIRKLGWTCFSALSEPSAPSRAKMAEAKEAVSDSALPCAAAHVRVALVDWKRALRPW